MTDTNDSTEKATTKIPAQVQAWETRRCLEQVDAVIASAIELDIFDTKQEGEFERVRILLELSRELSQQTIALAQIWEEMTAGLEHSVNESRRREPLKPDTLVSLFECLSSYVSGERSDALRLAEVANATAAHAKGNSDALRLAGLVVSLLRKDGIQADLVQFPGGPQVVIWNGSGNPARTDH